MFVNEKGEDTLNVANRPLNERLLPIEGAQTEETPFRNEINTSLGASVFGVPYLLNADMAAGVTNILNCAQLTGL